MEIDNIHYHTTGFLKDASYTSDLLKVLYKYKDSFGDAKSLTLNIEEIPPGMVDWKNKKTIEFSDNGESIIINLTGQKYTDNKGKVIGTPGPYLFYQSIEFVLERAKNEYSEKFKKENK